MSFEALRTPFARDHLHRAFAEMIRRRLGLHFLPHQWADMDHALRPVAAELCGGDVQRLMQACLDDGTAFIEHLARHLTVGESYFYREHEALDLLESTLLPALMRARPPDAARHLRLWSAGCSTGEEAYSLAIAAHRAVDRTEGWSVDVFGSDINQEAIRTAELGQYTSWSFRDVLPDSLVPYLRPIDGERIEVGADLRRSVRFGIFNLADEVPYPYGMDVIFCRNVLIYFDHPTAARVIEGLARALPEGGYLVLSLTETGLVSTALLEAVGIGPVTVFRRLGARAAAPAAPMDVSTRPEASAAAAFRRTPLHAGGRRSCAQETLAGRSVKSEDRDCLQAGVRSEQAPDAIHDRAVGGGVPAAEYSTRSHRQAAPAAAETRHETHHVGNEAGKSAYAEARAFADAGELERALESADRAVSADRLDARAHFLRGTILRALNRAADALHAFERAVYLDDTFVAARFALGTLLLQLRGPAVAARQLRALDMLLSRFPEDVQLAETDLTPRRMRGIILAMLS